MSGPGELVVEGIDVHYGVFQALFDVSLHIPSGTITALLGINGAGKSTLGRAISGLVHPSKGKIIFGGEEITHQPTNKINQAGLVFIPEGRGIFPGLSVIDNLRMAASGLPKQERTVAIDRAVELFPVLGTRRSQQAASLSGGEQQMLGLARALSVEPKFIIADEMSLGLAPLVATRVFETLEQVRGSGITVLLIEQFVHRALALADNCIILSHGSVSWSGPASKAGTEVVQRYLGAGSEIEEPAQVGD